MLLLFVVKSCKTLSQPGLHLFKNKQLTFTNIFRWYNSLLSIMSEKKTMRSYCKQEILKRFKLTLLSKLTVYKYNMYLLESQTKWKKYVLRAVSYENLKREGFYFPSNKN